MLSASVRRNSTFAVPVPREYLYLKVTDLLYSAPQRFQFPKRIRTFQTPHDIKDTYVFFVPSLVLPPYTNVYLSPLVFVPVRNSTAVFYSGILQK